MTQMFVFLVLLSNLIVTDCGAYAEYDYLCPYAVDYADANGVDATMRCCVCGAPARDEVCSLIAHFTPFHRISRNQNTRYLLWGSLSSGYSRIEFTRSYQGNAEYTA